MSGAATKLEPFSNMTRRLYIETVGCRVCRANLEDLQLRQEETAEMTDSRRKKYFQSSAGYLRRKK